MKTLCLSERDQLSAAKHVAFVFCGYHGDDAQKPSFARRVARRLRVTAISDNDYRVMNYYANPRSLSYVTALIEDFRDTNGIDRTGHVYVDEKLGSLQDLDRVSRTETRMFCVARLDELRNQLKAGGYGAVVLVYTDAIGLGCPPIERVARAASSIVVIVNGRRRAFRLDATARRALWWRRTMSRWRVDWILTLIFVPLAAFFAAKDAITHRKAG